MKHTGTQLAFGFSCAAFGLFAGAEWQQTRQPPQSQPDSVSFTGGVEVVLYDCRKKGCPVDAFKRSTHVLDGWHVLPPPPSPGERSGFWIIERPFGNDKDGHTISAGTLGRKA